MSAVGRAETRRVEPPDSNGIAASLSRRVGPNAGAVQIAEAMTVILQQIDAALAPVVGARGVAALYKRSVHVACSNLRWLYVAQDEPAALVRVLAQRSDVEAEAGANVFLRAFDDLLTSLIGSSLTERLLRSVQVSALNDAATRVTS